MRQIIDSAELAGKTIKEVKGDEHDHNHYSFCDLIFIFDDDTFIGLDVRDCTGDAYWEVTPDPPWLEDTKKLGFITEEEYQEIKGRDKQLRKAQQEILDRKKWKELNERFGSEDHASDNG